MTDFQPMKPTASGERIVLLDALRGFALFGILFVNMTWFTGFAVLSPEQRQALGTERIDEIVYWWIHFLVDGKFWSLFALLFGAGVAVQLMRSKSQGRALTGLFVRRLSVLVLIGLAHAIFLWFGDIVSLYAVVGFALLLFIRVNDRSLLFWAIGLALLPIVQSGIWMYANPDVDTRHGPYELLGEFGGGTYAEMFSTNWLFLKQRWFLAIYEGRFFKLLGMFLLGYWAARHGVFHKPNEHRRLLGLALVGGLLIGVPLNAVLATVPPPAGPASVSGWLLSCLQTIGIPSLCVAYASGFCLLYALLEPPAGKHVGGLAIFTYAGCMSLTNYIMQSVVGITIFYGCGLGYWGMIGAAWSVVLILAIYGLQSILSMWWLRHFRHGPLEWVWRCLTYASRLPNRRHLVESKG